MAYEFSQIIIFILMSLPCITTRILYIVLLFHTRGAQRFPAIIFPAEISMHVDYNGNWCNQLFRIDNFYACEILDGVSGTSATIYQTLP